jgi:hypothetical protein
MVLMVASVLLSKKITGLLLTNPWFDFDDTTAPCVRLALGISPTFSSESRLNTVTRPGFPLRATYRRRPSASAVT